MATLLYKRRQKEPEELLELDEPLSLVVRSRTSLIGETWGLTPPAPCANFRCACTRVRLQQLKYVASYILYITVFQKEAIIIHPRCSAFELTSSVPLYYRLEKLTLY